MAIIKINEGTTAWVTLAFKDRAGAPVSPTSMIYRIDCMTSGAAITPPTTILLPGTTPEITITALENALQDQNNPQEYRRMTITANYGLADVLNSTFDWTVNNLNYIP